MVRSLCPLSFKHLSHNTVLLDEPCPTHFPLYPRAKVADFGSGRLTRPYEPLTMNPITYFEMDATTAGWKPPVSIPTLTLLPKIIEANIIEI